MVEIGNCVLTEIFTGFGRLGASSEKVATEAAGPARSYLASDAVAGEFLADQLLLPLALAGGGSFTTTKLTQHSRTNMAVVSQFLPVAFETEMAENSVRVRIVKSQS
jgi:RNA 3'-terminal phosphate cyclase (ATP)